MGERCTDETRREQRGVGWWGSRYESRMPTRQAALSSRCLFAGCQLVNNNNNNNNNNNDMFPPARAFYAEQARIWGLASYP
ncbi:hypothetical protein BDFG_07121 [Blastomyces dermatitidis ATCC 26199]|nr:hypothetical protein BDFG_07121 [Blastomyces dermatitidis ATCC 26199]